MQLFQVVLFLLASVAVQSSHWTTYSDFIRSGNDTLKAFLDLLSRPQILERYWIKFMMSQGIKLDKIARPVLGFSWDNCGPSDPLQIRSLSVSPDPISVPGYVTVSFDIDLQTNITSPLQLDVVIKKKILFVWVEVPCIHNLGSCSYPDACSLLIGAVKEDKLPEHCPIMKGEYKDSIVIRIGKNPLPSWLENGDYSVHVKGHTNGREMFCYDVKFSIEG